MNLIEKVKEAKEYIQSIDSSKFDIAIILGTGLGSIVKDIENKKIIKYKDIPNFPVSTVVGHAGELITGELMGKKVLALNGRFHYYEGYAMKEVVFPVRVIKALGIEKIIITNAAGGMNPSFEAGDLMMITDHINFMGDNPLIGRNYEEFGPRFPDMSQAYNRELLRLAESAGDRLNIKLQKGVYIGVSGPTYETPAELKMLRAVGGDAVGMSTVPEVIVANHMSMKVLGISCITDMALGDNLEPLDHARVVETANKAMTRFVSLVKEIVSSL
ncbi:purine-nucleoside phosphorylase [Clostridium tetanomorphum]|uniref:Purine nucleoside phosphorylase n=1 Tax=Clostridium tetanomorphum TaxID=1553 RepID=A0A923E515_CLOTT|nr:purine-nucleoside phosphorylase [Clostridium tetanomorphum]MBC2396555.1 purine-nucleoside phosphorylase [Clostridium tetanomorphum]MBP1863882.1 purine-nucleoside phosphorylase [Clostridium tetanomorphum]NRS84960.1 purine-nucleoside phosphorylase [Clostridium tetanomorphum]NRZ98176.1 purine-nucleoside phosphorylase [Clostridium tetanomorphum]SQB91519.1 purine nucleoside phosphorylase I, inosine and guanosine-specific [Clostridium tetanomorphum]